MSEFFLICIYSVIYFYDLNSSSFTTLPTFSLFFRLISRKSRFLPMIHNKEKEKLKGLISRKSLAFFLWFIPRTKKNKGKVTRGSNDKMGINCIPRTVENTRMVQKGEMKYKNTKRTIVVILISNSKHCQVINGWVIPLQENFPRKRNVIISPKSEG